MWFFKSLAVSGISDFRDSAFLAQTSSGTRHGDGFTFPLLDRIPFLPAIPHFCPHQPYS
jgi:hypothetical protein